MSKQAPMTATLAVEDAEGCCTPLSEAALDPERAAALAHAYKALGDPVRLRLLSMIVSAPDEICVCDVTGAFEQSGPTISHHLKVLREAGLVDCERRGTWVYYWPLRDRLQQLSSMLATSDLAPAGVS